MRSAILVDAVLNYEIKGEHIHITDSGGGVHLALSRGVFAANLRKANAINAALVLAPTNVQRMRKR
jgi:hypothetical protein